MEETVTLVCEDSNEGIMTGIYEAYAGRLDHGRTFLQIGEEDNFRLFTSYVPVIMEQVKANKVMHTIIERFGMETFQIILQALASRDPDRGQAVYQSIVFGLKGQYQGNLIDCIYEDSIAKVVQLSTTTWYELHHLYGFLRFEELENGMLFATIHPKNRLLSFMGDHFSNRFPKENFAIFDETYDLCLVHAAGKPFVVVTGDLVRRDELPGISGKEKAIQELFCYFCHKISIKERENGKLQQQNLPLRFRDDMTEFKRAE